MTPTKLITIALAIATVVAAGLLPSVREYLIPIGTLLLGLAGPEVGKSPAVKGEL